VFSGGFIGRSVGWLVSLGAIAPWFKQPALSLAAVSFYVSTHLKAGPPDPNRDVGDTQTQKCLNESHRLAARPERP